MKLGNLHGIYVKRKSIEMHPEIKRQSIDVTTEKI